MYRREALLRASRLAPLIARVRGSNYRKVFSALASFPILLSENYRGETLKYKIESTTKHNKKGAFLYRDQNWQQPSSAPHYLLGLNLKYCCRNCDTPSQFLPPSEGCW